MAKDPPGDSWPRPIQPDDQATELDLDGIIGEMRRSLAGETLDDEADLRLSFRELTSRDPDSIDEQSIGFLSQPMPAIHASLEDASASDLLQVRYAVRMAIGGGVYKPTGVRGELRGARSYDIAIVDEFEVGFDERRSVFEIVLDPNLAPFGAMELAGGSRCALDLSPDGSVQLLKPKGVRLDIHPVLRNADGTRGSFQIHTGLVGESSSVVLPHDPTTLHIEFAEYMLGFGLTDEEDPGYAFTVYIAFRLEPGEPVIEPEPR